MANTCAVRATATGCRQRSRQPRQPRLSCRARRRRGVINGRKIWTTEGHLANHIFVLARTSPNEAKHRVISFLLVDMRQSGFEVRPIKMMSGESDFNEVFFSDARCAREAVLGEVNGGWTVAMSLLGNERGAGRQ